MKLDLSTIQQGHSGFAVITCEDTDDYQKLSVVIKRGDIIHTKIRRKVDKGNSKRVEIHEADVLVQEIEYQAGVNEMRLRGVLTENTEFGSVGSFQRILLFNGTEFTLFKEEWLPEDIEILKSAVSEQEQFDTIFVLFKNQSCVVLSEKFQILNTFNQTQKQNLFTSIAQFIATHSDHLKCVVVFSTNSINREFIQFMKQNATQYGVVELCKTNAFIEEKAKNGTIQEIQDILKKPEVHSRIVAVVDSNFIQNYHKLMNVFEKDCDKVAFGEQDFKKAFNYGAIDTLLVTETFVENLVPKRRQAFMRMMDYLTRTGSKVLVFPKKASHYEELEKLSGIAATLRFKTI